MEDTYHLYLSHRIPTDIDVAAMRGPVHMKLHEGEGPSQAHSRSVRTCPSVPRSVRSIGDPRLLLKPPSGCTTYVREKHPKKDSEDRTQIYGFYH